MPSELLGFIYPPDLPEGFCVEPRETGVWGDARMPIGSKLKARGNGRRI